MFKCRVSKGYHGNEQLGGGNLRHFGDGKRNTNAFTESMNRQMKDLNRAARSMSFEMFRAKMLFSVEHRMKRKEKPRRESPFTMGYGVPTDADLARGTRHGGHGGAYREALGALLGASHQHHYTAFGSRLEVPFINRLFRIPLLRIFAL